MRTGRNIKRYLIRNNIEICPPSVVGVTTMILFEFLIT